MVDAAAIVEVIESVVGVIVGAPERDVAVIVEVTENHAAVIVDPVVRVVRGVLKEVLRAIVVEAVAVREVQGEVPV